MSVSCQNPSQPIPDQSPVTTHDTPSARSWFGLCATSFFLADANGVTMPFVSTYLIDCGWTYQSIGLVVSAAAMISWLIQLPAGLLIDVTFGYHKMLLAAASLLVGTCMGLLPIVSASAQTVGFLLIAAAIGLPFFGPLTNAVMLQLIGHRQLGPAAGVQQSANHLGNIAAAATAMLLVQYFSVGAVFFCVAAISLLAAVSVTLIRSLDLHQQQATNGSVPAAASPAGFLQLIRSRGVLPLLIAAVLFHLANAPVMPLVAQRIRAVGGTHSQVAAVVLIAQFVMVPVALMAGAWGSRFGQKRTLAIGFLVLPIRIALYTLTDNPACLVALQALDGVGAGIIDVSVIAYCAAMTRDRGYFNSLLGALGTAVGVGGVLGPLLSGTVVQHLGFSAAFLIFAAIAMLAAAVFIGWMPVMYGNPRV